MTFQIGLTNLNFFNAKRNALLSCMCLTINLILLSTLLWPIEGMSEHLKLFSQLLPLHYPIESLRSILFRGFLINNFFALRGIFVLITWIIGFIFLNYFMTVKLNKNKL